MSYSIRLATPDDRPHLLAIIRELLPGSNAEHRYDWLYRGGTDGPALTWLAIDDQTGEPAGSTSFFRRRMLVAGEVVPGALGGDGFVRPAFRRRGIGAALHTASRRDMERHGIQVMFGTPMPANQSPLAHAGAFDVTVSTRFVRPLSAKLLHMPDPVARLMDPLLRPEKQDLRLDPVRPNDPRIDALWRATWLELGVATVRDAAFYTWRFLQAPAQRQQAFVRGDDVAGVHEIAAVDLARETAGLAHEQGRRSLDGLQSLARHDHLLLGLRSCLQRRFAQGQAMTIGRNCP